MQINLKINNKNEIKLLQRLAEVSYDILTKFITLNHIKYKHILPLIEYMPFVISINNKFKCIYGQAYYTKYKNKIDSLTVEYSFELDTFNKRQIKLIAAHELAHSIDFLMRGDGFKDHDHEWKEIVELLGGQPAFTIDIF
jgi:hypothetical protein